MFHYRYFLPKYGLLFGLNHQAYERLIYFPQVKGIQHLVLTLKWQPFPQHIQGLLHFPIVLVGLFSRFYLGF